MAKIIGYVKAVSTNKNGYVSACIANQKEPNGVWVGLKAKEAKYNGMDIVKGMDVEAEYDADNFNNAISIAKREKSKPAGGNQRGGSSGGYQKKERDMTGVEVGHCIKGAFYATKHKKTDVVAEAKIVHDVTCKVKAEYAAANPNMSDYDAGAAVGHSVLIACEIIGSSDRVKLTDLEKLTKQILKNVVPPVVEYVKAAKDGSAVEEEEEVVLEEEEEEKPTPAPAAKGKPGRKPAAKKQAEPEPVGDDFDDSDIPF